MGKKGKRNKGGAGSQSASVERDGSAEPETTTMTQQPAGEADPVEVKDGIEAPTATASSSSSPLPPNADPEVVNPDNTDAEDQQSEGQQREEGEAESQPKANEGGRVPEVAAAGDDLKATGASTESVKEGEEKEESVVDGNGQPEASDTSDSTPAAPPAPAAGGAAAATEEQCGAENTATPAGGPPSTVDDEVVVDPEEEDTQPAAAEEEEKEEMKTKSPVKDPAEATDEVAAEQEVETKKSSPVVAEKEERPAEVGVQQLLADLRAEADDLEAKLRAVDGEIEDTEIELQQEKVNALEKADILREHAKVVKEEIHDMRVEIENFPSDDSLVDMKTGVRNLSEKLMASARRSFEAEEQCCLVDKQCIVERQLGQQTLEQHQLVATNLHAMVNSKRYLYGTVETKLDVPTTSRSIDALTEGREMSAFVAHSAWKRLAEEEEAEDARRVKHQLDTKQLIFDIENRTDDLRDDLTYSWNFEKEGILRQKHVLEAINKEHAFHLKRGSSHAKPTQRTATEKRLHERQLELSIDVRTLIVQHEDNRDEILELERVGNSLLGELEGKREQFEERKLTLQAALKKHRKVHVQLREEKSGWKALHQEMEEMIKERKRHHPHQDVSSSA